MAKHTGITIKIGAAHDEVHVDSDKGSFTFDRAQMRIDGQHKQIGALRRTVVDAFRDGAR